jgi:hypothetical protein
MRRQLIVNLLLAVAIQSVVYFCFFLSFFNKDTVEMRRLSHADKTLTILNFDRNAETLKGYKENNGDLSEYGIHVIGERHTGTSWLQNHLQQCFGDQIKVYDRLSRHKYWFQFDDETKDFGLVVATSRNIYDWLCAMMEKPLHAPIHYDAVYNLSMYFSDFIHSEWSPDRDRWMKLNVLKDDQRLLYAYENANLYINESNGRPLYTHQCYDGFTFFDVVPCSKEDRMRSSFLVSVNGDSIDDGDSSAVYEMKKDHPIAEMMPYKSILELRRDKMINFHSEVPKFSSVKHYIPFKFEDMVTIGTAPLLQDIEEKMGLQSRCQPEKLQVPDNGNKKIRLSLQEIAMLNDGVDWSAESLVGYELILGIHIIEERIRLEQAKTNNTSSPDTLVYPGISSNMTKDLIDFAVIGFPKCGTTFLLTDVLGASPHVYMGAQDARGNYDEMHHLAKGKLPEFMSYFQYQNSSSIKRGFKEPSGLHWEPTLYHLSTFFPKTKLIVSIRHPILWFESLYNYRMRTDYRYAVNFNITPHNRVGECKRELKSKWRRCTSTDQPCIKYQAGFGCTDEANYHVHLSRLGWTPRNSSRELTLLHHRMEQTFKFSQSRLFLMELNQIDPRKSKTRADALINDLESFLELEQGSLPRFKKISNESYKTSELALKRLISICDDEYHGIRKILLEQAKYVLNCTTDWRFIYSCHAYSAIFHLANREASAWIQEFFLLSPYV